MTENGCTRADRRRLRSISAPTVVVAALVVVFAGESAADVSTGTYRLTTGARATVYDDDGKRIESCGPVAEALLRRFETVVVVMGDPASVNGEKWTFEGVDSYSNPSTEILRRPREQDSDFIVEVHVGHDGRKAQGLVSIAKRVNSGSRLPCADVFALTGRYSAP